MMRSLHLICTISKLPSLPESPSVENIEISWEYGNGSVEKLVCFKVLLLTLLNEKLASLFQGIVADTVE